MLLLAALLSQAAHASCGEVGPQLDLAELALVDQDVEKAQQHVDAARTILSCGIPATTEQVVQLRLLEGVLAFIDGDSDRSNERFAAARRLAPDHWIDDLGGDLRDVWAAASLAEGRGQVRVIPQPVPSHIWIDGVPRGPTSSLPAGLVLVQIGDLVDGAHTMAEVGVTRGGVHPVDSGLSTGPQPETELGTDCARRWDKVTAKLKGASLQTARTSLLDFIAEYEQPAAQARIWLPELAKARSKLQETEDQLRGEFGDTNLDARNKDSPLTLGLVANVSGGWLGGGAPRWVDQPTSAAAFGGLGPGAELGLAWRPTPGLLTRLTIGYQSILLSLDGTDAPVQLEGGVGEAEATRHHGGAGWLALGTPVGPVQILVGPAGMWGPVRTSGAVELDGVLANPTVTGSVTAIGARLGADLPLVDIGGHALALSLNGGALADGERVFTRGSLGFGVVPGT